MLVRTDEKLLKFFENSRRNAVMINTAWKPIGKFVQR